MRWIHSLILVTALMTVSATAPAIDVSPSKDTIPRSSFDTGGNRFSIFNGDPKRIQRANEVDCKQFTAKVQISPNPLSLKEAESIGPNPSMKISFWIQNHSKRTFTLSFPTAQRWDFRILDAANNLVYSYTDDHEFVQVVGTSMVNQDDKLNYSETIEFEDLSVPLAPGNYTVQAVMANYPEIKAQTQFVVQP
jgi:Intracellular proteinase inhibitor